MQCHRCYTFPYNVLLFHVVGMRKSGDEINDAMHRCYTFPYNVLLIHAVGMRKPGDETCKSMSQL